MAEKLISAIGIAVLIAQPLLTFSIGIETGGPQLRALAGMPGLISRYFLATFVVMPGIAIALGKFAILPNWLWVGLALMSMAPPAPPATRRLRKMGDLDVGLAWQAVAFVIAAVTMPATVAFADSLGFFARDLNLAWGPVFQRGALFFAGPMLAGLVVRRYVPAVADALVRPVGTAANVALGVLALLALGVALPVIWNFGIAPIGVVAAFTALAIVIAHVLGGPRRDTRVTLAAMLAARFPVPALLLAQANGALKTVLPVVLVYVVAGTLLVPLYDRLTAPSAPATRPGRLR